MSNFLLSNLVEKLQNQAQIVIMIVSVLGAIFYWLLGQTPQLIVAIAGFTLVQVSMSLVRAHLMASIASAVAPAARATIFSAVSVLSRIGMIISLGLLHAMLNPSPDIRHCFTVANVFSVYGLCLLILTVFLALAIQIRVSRSSRLSREVSAL